MARQGKSIVQWVGAQTDDCAGIRIQLGTRAAGTQVGIVEVEGRGMALPATTVAYSSPFEQLARTVEDLALDAGWGSALGQEPVLRLYALDKKGKSISTYQRTAKAQTSNSSVADIHALSREHRRALDKCLDTICEQAKTNTRTIDILTETLAHRESMMAHALEAMMDASQDATEQKAINAMLETALDNQGAGEQDGLKSVQGQVLQSVMGLITGQGAAPEEEDHNGSDMTAEQIYNLMKDNPMLRFDVSKLFEDESTTQDASE